MANFSLREQCVPSNALAPPFPVTRRSIEDHIETLIDLLDAMDGDPDREDSDPAGGNVEDEGEETLGSWASPIYGPDQRRPARNRRAIEAEHERRENERSERAYAAMMLRKRRTAA